jgi:hypothetical protein
VNSGRERRFREPFRSEIKQGFADLTVSRSKSRVGFVLLQAIGD